MKCICKFAYRLKPEFKEVNSGEYMVEPNQAFTLQEIFDKFRLGEPINDLVRNNYQGEVVPDDFVDNPLPINDLEQLDALQMLNDMQNRANTRGGAAPTDERSEDVESKPALLDEPETQETEKEKK